MQVQFIFFASQSLISFGMQAPINLVLLKFRRNVHSLHKIVATATMQRTYQFFLVLMVESIHQHDVCIFLDLYGNN